MKNCLPHDAMKSSSTFSVLCVPHLALSVQYGKHYSSHRNVWYMTLAKAISLICGFGIREPAQNCQHKFE